MGTHASADVFYGISWTAEEEPDTLRDYLDAADDGEGDWNSLEHLLEELGVSALLDVDYHGHHPSDYTSYSVRVKGTQTYCRLGDPTPLVDRPPVSDEALAAIDKVVDYFGAEGATIGWQVTVSYG